MTHLPKAYREVHILPPRRQRKPSTDTPQLLTFLALLAFAIGLLVWYLIL